MPEVGIGLNGVKPSSKKHELADWHCGLMKLTESFIYRCSDVARLFFVDFVYWIEKIEAASICWDVDLKAKVFALRDTKNRDSHTLPMSDFIYDLFLRRKTFSKNNFVFPSGQ